MSMTKNSPAFDAWCEEYRTELEHTYQDYLEEVYLANRTDDPPATYKKREEGGAPQPQQPTPKK